MTPTLLQFTSLIEQVKARFAKFTLSMPRYRRMLLPVLLAVLFVQPDIRDIVVSSLSDAFWQVSVFVAMTLMVYHLFADKISRLYTNQQGETNSLKQIIVASAMGMLPGCGGAIVVITQFVSGKMSFGAVVAVLTATMGDAAFLLLAAEPLTGGAVLILCFVVGIVSGSFVNAIHDKSFLRNTNVDRADTFSQACEKDQIKSEADGEAKYKVRTPIQMKVQGVLWQWLMIPGVFVGLLFAGQIDAAAFFSLTDSQLQYLGAALAFTFIVLWALTREVTNYESLVAEDKKARQDKAFQKVALDTNFVTSWVVAAFLLFGLFNHYSEIDLAAMINHYIVLAPMVAVVIGMIPGCGPQIIVTSLYLTGSVPLSAQIGNAISNDGDALFPAIALSPKVALVATCYSSIPALITAYAYFWLFE